MAAEQELGAVVGRFESDNRRRRRIFAVAVPVGGVVAALTGLWFVVLAGRGGSPSLVLLPCLACGLALGALAVGIQQAWLSRTRPDEAFTLHEGGFVHSYAGKSLAISWDEIVKIANEGRDNALYRVLGADVRYRVKLRSAVGGRRVVMITGITEDALRLGGTVQHAVHHGTRPKPEAP
ncbi:hypothetical protein [Amycolatopsis minnesotensis]|uniref:DUF304 domain-containing protein n=1 Tax=Amycolatopsis minnesotensis TaxID=337894 RepID=A0ABP5BSE4_9PSEU